MAHLPQASGKTSLFDSVTGVYGLKKGRPVAEKTFPCGELNSGHSSESTRSKTLDHIGLEYVIESVT